MALPPPPPGFVPASDDQLDPLEYARMIGARVTSGFRSREHNAAVGGVPNSYHLDADALDTLPGDGYGMGDLRGRWTSYLAHNAGRFPGARVLNEGDHVHVQIPGWGGAPGLPAPPEGFTPDAGPPAPSDAPAPQQGPDAGAGAPSSFAPGARAQLLSSTSPLPMGAERFAGQAPIPAGEVPAGSGPIAPAPLINFIDVGRAVKNLVPAFRDAPPPADPRDGGPVSYPGHGSGYGGERYSTRVDPAAISLLQGAYEKGADAAGLHALAGQLGVMPDNIEGLVDYRDRYGKFGSFKPADAHVAAPGPMPGETTPDYYRRVAGNQALVQGGGNPFNPTLAEGLRDLNTVAGNSPEQADQNVQTARELPFVGDAIAIDEGLGKIGRGRWTSGAKDVALGAIAFVPGGKGLQVGSHVVDSMALKALAKGDSAEAERLIRSVTDDAISRGGSVTLQLPTGEYIPLGAAHFENNALPGQLARTVEQGGRLELTIPPPSRVGSIGSELPQEAANEGAALGGPRLPPPEADAAGAASAPVRQRDYINIPPPPRGFSPEGGMSEAAPPSSWPFGDSPLGQTRQMGQRYSDEELAALADRAQTRDFQPYPSTPVRSEAEAMRGNPGTQEPIPAPDELQELSTRRVVTANGQPAYVTGPVDTSQALRLMGGVQDQGGELAAMGVGAPRKMDFGTDRGLGALVNKSGRSLEDAARALWDKGYFPAHSEPPTVQDLLDRLHAENVQGHRFFLPEDGGEVDRFNAALGQRNAVDAATQEGRPLVGERGRPLSLDELRASEPPEHALNDLQDAKDRVGNINLRNASGAVDPQRGLEASERLTGFHQDRTPMTFGDMLQGARNTHMQAEDLLSRRIGQGVDPAQAIRARQLLMKSTDELAQMGAELDHASEADKAQFAEHVLRHLKIYEQASDMAATAGRTLGSFRVPVSSKAINQTIHRLTTATGDGSVDLETVGKFLADLHQNGADEAAMNRFLMKAVNPATKLDKLLEVFYNSILSAPTTHAVNMVGNTLSTAVSVPEYALASLVGRMARSKDRILGSEVSGYVSGMIHGTRKGYEAMRTTLRTGRPVDTFSKMDLARREAIGGLAGKVIRVPGRFLMAEDELFKGISRQGTLGRLASRQASLEGKTGEGFAARVAELKANPSDEMQVQARDFARYMTFQNEPSRFGRWIQDRLDNHQWLRFFVPFVRTQENLVRFALERSPAALILPEFRAAIRAGGAQRDLALSKVAIGTTIGLLAYQAAKNGYLTGGESLDPGTRDLMHAAGWQPYSIKVGDRYVSYRRLDPISLTISTAADLATYDKYMTPKEREHSWLILGQMVGKNLADSFYVQNLENLYDMAASPTKAIPRQVASIVGALTVPNLIAQPTASMDSVERSQAPDKKAGVLAQAAQTIINRVKGRIPGLRQTLPPRLDPFGQPLANYGRLGPDIVSPFPQRLVNPDPSFQAMLDSGLRVKQPGQTVDRVPLTQEQHRDYWKTSGGYIKQDLAAIVRTPEWQRATPAERRDWFEADKRDARADARADLGLDTLADGPAVPPPPGFASPALRAAPKKGAAPPPPPKGFIPAPPKGFVPAH